MKKAIQIFCYIVTALCAVFVIAVVVDGSRVGREAQLEIEEQVRTQPRQTTKKPGEEIAYGTDIYKENGKLYYWDTNSEDAHEIPNFDLTNVRAFVRRSSGYIQDPRVIANNTQVLLVNQDRNSLQDFSKYVRVPSKLKEVNYYTPDYLWLFNDTERFYVVTSKDMFELPVDSGSFIANSSFIKDSMSVFYLTKRIPGADPNTFRAASTIAPRGWEPIHYIYGKDKNRVYYKDEVVEGADPATFTVYERNFYEDYARDRSSVFYEGKKILGADPTTFTIIHHQPYEGCGEGIFYSKDKNSVYYKDRAVFGADPATFKGLINSYGTDAKNSFFQDININLSPKALNLECDYG